MTIKEIEILISNDYLMDMLVYARCQLCDLGISMHIADLRFERCKLFDTLKDIKREVDEISPAYQARCTYRKGYNDIKL